MWYKGVISRHKRWSAIWRNTKLAYSRGIISSPKIEKACRENVTFMALACGQVPDHSTIAALISSMKEEYNRCSAMCRWSA